MTFVFKFSFSAWPYVKRISQKWKRITEPLVQILMQEEIVYTEAHDGKWLTVKQALFDRLPDSETKVLLQKVLLAANVPVVSVPSHVLDVIANYSTVTEITAHVTRVVLKRVPVCYKQLDKREKLLLLQFCLRDQQFAELCDLELLPLSNGTFTSFSNQEQRIYISSAEHSRELLPGLEHRFLDETVDGDIIQMLKDAAKQGKALGIRKSIPLTQDSFEKTSNSAVPRADRFTLRQKKKKYSQFCLPQDGPRSVTWILG